MSISRRNELADGSVDQIGLGLAGLLAVLPLLPAGPTYLGLRPFGYLDLALVPLVLLWIAGRAEARRRTPVSWPLPLWPGHLLIAVTLGAAVGGLVAEHRLDSPVLAAVLWQRVPDLLGVMDQAAHPLQPLRVALTFVEGWVVFLLIADLCRRAPDPLVRGRLALAGWVTGGAIVSVLAVLQYVTRYQLHPYWVKANPHIIRSHATLDDPNALGAWLVLGIGLLIGWLYHAASRRRLAVALCLLLTTGMLTTMSRAAAGGIVLAVIIVLALTPSAHTRRQQALRKAGRLALAALIVIALGSAAFRAVTRERTRTQPTTQTELVLKTLDPRESSDWVLRGRLAWWRAAAGMFADHPLTGVGLGRYPRLLEDYGGGRSRENAHNLLLQLLAEAGVPGALALVAFVIVLCRTFWRALRDPADDRTSAIALGGSIGIAGFLLTHATGHTLLLVSGQMLFASFAAAAGILVAPRQVEARRPRPMAMLLAGLAAMLFYPIVATARGIAPVTGAWGYVSGFFPEEPTGDGGSYRWTGSDAMMDLDVPAGATVLELPIAAPVPLRQGTPTRVWITAGRWIHERSWTTPGTQTIRVPLDRGRDDGPGRIVVRLRVEPTFRPADEDPESSDLRALGVQVLRPHFTR